MLEQLPWGVEIGVTVNEAATMDDSVNTQRSYSHPLVLQSQLHRKLRHDPYSSRHTSLGR
jgi:hypothetical protein